MKSINFNANHGFHDFPSSLGTSGCQSHPPTQVLCEPTMQSCQGTLPRQGGGISAGTRTPRPNASRAQNRGLPGQSWFAKRWQDLQSCKPAEHRQVVDNVIILGGTKIDNPWQCLKSVRSSRDLGANPSRGVCQKLKSIALFATAGVALPRTGLAPYYLS